MKQNKYFWAFNIMALSCSTSLARAANMIVTDGYSNTTVNNSGNTYDVRTSTVSGSTGFNSFKKFDVNSGTTVNLHLPDNTSNLVNLVRDATTNIDGVLNSYKDGQIGGNIFMLNPNGIVIGAGGVVNVGALIMSTPTKDFMDSVFDAPNKVSQTAADKIISGDIPLNKNATITARGKIVANDKVGISTGKVNLGGTLELKNLVNTGGVDIDGRLIVIEQNALVKAGGGNIDIAAKNTDLDQVTTGITVAKGAKLYGRDIKLSATTQLEATGLANNPSGGSTVIGAPFGGIDFSMFAGGGAMNAETFIDIQKGAELHATNDLSLNVFSSLNLPNWTITPMLFSSAYGQINNNSYITVADDAKLFAGHDISLQSISKNYLDVWAVLVTGELAKSLGKDFFADGDGVAFALAEMYADNKIDIGNAVIRAGRNLDIEAQMDKQLFSSAFTFGLSGSKVNFDIGLSFSDTKNTVAVGGDISGQNVTLNSNLTANEYTSSASSSGLSDFMSNIIEDAKFTVSHYGNALKEKITGKVTEAGNSRQQGKAKPATIKIAGAVAYSESSNLSQAYLKDNSKASATADMTIKAAIDNITHNMATSGVAGGSTEETQTSNGAAAALNIASYVNTAQAYIGKNATVDAEKRLNLLSTVKLPRPFDAAGSYIKKTKDAYDAIEGDSFWDYIKGGLAIDYAIITKGNPLSAIYSDLGNTLTNSTVSIKDGKNKDQKFAFSGSVGIFDYNNNSSAFISDGAKINQNNSGNKRIVDVNAVTDVTGVNIGGVFSLPMGLETEGMGIGGTFQMATYNNTTNALIGNGVKLTAEALRVAAQNDSVNVFTTLGFSSTGESAYSGMAGYLGINNATLAQISGGAEVSINATNAQLTGYKDYFGEDIDYTKATLAATDDAVWVNVSGDISKRTGGNGVVAAAAISQINRLTHATWGDFKTDLFGSTALSNVNKALSANGTLLYDITQSGNNTGFADLVKDLNLEARSRGLNISVAVAAGVSTNKAPGAAPEEEREIEMDNFAGVDVPDEQDAFDVNVEAPDDNLQAGDKNSFGLGISASYAHNDFDNSTAAYANNVRSNKLQDLNIKASDVTGNYAVTGALTAEAASTTTDVAIGASASYNAISSAVLAFLENADLTKAGKIQLDAANRSKMMAVSVGAAISTSADSGASLSGVVNVNDINNKTQTWVKNTKVTADALNMSALDASRLWQVGTGLTVSKNTGAGGVVGWNVAENTTSSEIDGNSNITAADGIEMDSVNQMDINSISTGGSASKKNSIATTGSYNKISNTTINRVNNSTLNGKLQMKAENASAILATPTGSGAGKNAGGSIVIGVNRISDITSNTVTGSTLTNGGDTKLEAVTRGKIKSFANSIGVGEKAGVGSTGTYNDIRNTTESKIINSQITADNLSLNALDMSYILSETAGIGIAKGVGMGLTMAINRVANNTTALLSGSTVNTSGDVALSAAYRPSSLPTDSLPDDVRDFDNGNKNSITTVAVGGGVSAGGSGFAAGLTGVYADIGNKADSKIEGGSTTAKDISLVAEDDSGILTVAIAASGGAKAGVGAVTSTNIVKNSVEASVGGTTQTTIEASGNVEIDAESNADIVSAAAGASGGGKVGVAANVSVNRIANNVAAGLTNSILHAAGSLGIAANSHDNIDFYYGAISGGGSFGGSGVVGVNLLKNKANAIIDGSTVTVDAKNSLNGKKGVSVAALVDDTLDTFGGSVSGAGSVAVAGNVGVLDVENEAAAKVNASAVTNSSNSGNLEVDAENKTGIRAVTGTATGAGTAAVGASVVTASVSDKTTAEISGSGINMNGDVAVAAKDTTNYSTVLVGAAIAGTAAGVGNASAAAIGNKTTALVDDSQITSGGNTTIDAQSKTGLGTDGLGAMAIGGLAGSGTAAVGASIMVNTINNQTTALAKNSAFDIAKTMTVNAAGSDEVNAYLVTGGFAGTAAVSGNLAVNSIGSSVTAGIESDKLKTSGNVDVAVSAKDLTVSSQNKNKVSDTLAAVAGSGTAAVGASVEVVSLQGTSNAYIRGNMPITATNDINVTAKGSSNNKSLLLNGAAAGVAGITGMVSVINIGHGAYNFSDYTTGTGSDGTTGGVSDMTNDLSANRKGALDSVENQPTGMGFYNQVAEAASDAPEQNISVADSGQKTNEKSVSASVDLGGNSLKTLTGDINVMAAETINSEQFSGSVNAAGVAAVGASVAVANVDSNTSATIKNAGIYSGKNLNIRSELKQYLSNNAFVGGIAPYASVEGGVAVVTADNITEAALGKGSNLHQAVAAKVAADSESDILTRTASLAGAIGSAGVSVSTIDKTGKTNAYVDEGAKIGVDADDKVSNLEVDAANNDKATAEAYALTGGAVSGTGAVASVTVKDAVNAALRKNSAYNLSGDLSVNTNDAHNITAKTFGLGVAGLQVGASYSQAKLTVDNNASVDEGVKVTAKNAKINAGQEKADVTADSVASGGALLGVNAGSSEAEISGKVKTSIGNKTEFNIADTAKFMSSSRSNVKAESTAINGGAVAIGATNAKAFSNLNTQTVLGSEQNVDTNKLDIYAVANTDISASNQLGSGGVIAASGGSAIAENRSDVSVKIGESGKSSRYDTDYLNIKAEHNLVQNAFLDSRYGGVLAGSGGSAKSVSNSAVSVDVTGSKILANNVLIDAVNNYTKNSDDDNLYIGSGGVITISSPGSTTQTTHKTTVSFADNSSITKSQEKLQQLKKNDYDFRINAINNINAHDKVRMVSGAPLPFGGVTAEMTDNSTATIKFDKTALNSINDMNLNAAGNVNMSTDVSASLYGTASVVTGKALTKTTQNNNILALNGSRVLAGGNLYANAGQSLDDNLQTARVSALSQIWNNTAIPISTNKATGSLTYNNLINIGSGSSLLSEGDISLVSQHGSSEVYGESSTYNLYNAVFGTETSYYDREFNNNSSVSVNGLVRAGVNNIRNIAIDGSGNVTVNGSSEDAEGYYKKKTSASVYEDMVKQLTKLNEMLVDYGQDEENKLYYEREISALKAKMKSMGLIDENGTLRKNAAADYIEIADITAGAGTIEIVSDKVTGGNNGKLAVSGGAQITIDNQSQFFLDVNDLTLKDGQDGQIIFNHKQVKNRGDLAGFGGNIDTNAGQVHEKTITINSSYKDANGRAPSIDINGNILNYGGDVNIKSSGSIYTSGAVRGKTIRLKSDGDIVQNAGNYVYHVGGDPAAAWKDITDKYIDGSKTGPTNTDEGDYSSSLVASNNIYLSGRYLDLNGLIQSGTADWNLVINDDNLSLVLSDGRVVDIADATADYQKKIAKDPSASELYALAGTHGNVSAYYNVITGQVEIDDVRVQGGYIELNGHIMNTSTKNGELRVADGYGRLNVINNSDFDIVLNDIDIGDRISGRIKITDTAQKGTDGKYLTTIYTRNGNTITAESNAGTSAIAAAIDANGVSSANYNVLNGQRYIWLEGIESITEKETLYNSASFWGIDWLVPDDATKISEKMWTKTTVPLRDGEKVTTGNSSGNIYEYSSDNITIDDWKQVGYEKWTETSGWWIFSVDNTYIKNIEQRGDKTIYEHSLKADNPVKISFQGFDKADMKVKSKSNILLNGISNTGKTGSVSLVTDKGIDSTSSLAHVVAGNNVSLSANTGIGNNNGITVNLLGQNALLNATNSQSGNINLNSVYDVTFGKIINSGGNVKLLGSRNILAKDETSLISGTGIELVSDYGKITGSNGDALNIQTDYDNGGTILAKADGDINLKQAAGDLGIDQIISNNGDVTLDVAGAVYDANEDSVPSIKTRQAMEKRWKDMGLSGYSGAALDEKISEYENLKTAEYFEYWNLKNGVGADGVFRYSDIQRAAFVANGLSDAEISSMEQAGNERFTQLSQNDYGTGFDAGYRYTATDADKTAIAAGAGWNRSQLENVFEASKLDASTGGRLDVEQANISGHNVKVTAGKGIGKENGELILSLRDMENWTAEEKLQFAAAERDNVSLADDGDTITVSLREDVDIVASGSMNLKSGEHIYLGSEEDINIDSLVAGAGKDITISARNGIYNVAVGDKTNITANNLTLESENGSVGKNDKLLKIDLTGKLNARAAEGVFIKTENDLNIDYIYSPKDVVLKAGKIVDFNNNDLVNIRAGKVYLAANEVGEDDNALDIALTDNADALVKIEANNNVNLNNAENTALNVDIEAENLKINSTKGGDVNVASANVSNDAAFNVTDGNLELNALSIGRDLSIEANRDFAIGGVNIGRNFTVNNLGNVTADNLQIGGSFNADVNKLIADNLQINENADIATADSLQLDNSIITGALDMVAGGNIKLSGTTAGGDMTATSGAAMNLSDVNAENLHAWAQNDMQLRNVSSFGDLSANTVNGNLQGDNIVSHYNITLNTDFGDILVGTVTSVAGALNMAAGGDLQASQLKAAEVDLAAGKSIGRPDAWVNVAADKISASAKQNIYLNAKSRSANGDSNFGNIEAENGDVVIAAANNALLNGNIKAKNGKVSLTAQKSIYDKLQDTANGTIQTGDVTLIAQNGTVGKYGEVINLAAKAYTGSGVTASGKEIHLNQVNGDMVIKSLNVGTGDINLSVDGNIFGAADGGPHIIADNITLESRNGKVGEEGRHLILQPNYLKAGRINIKAKEGIAFEKKTPHLWSDYLIAAGKKILMILPRGRFYVNKLDAAEAEVRVAAKHNSKPLFNRIDTESKMIKNAVNAMADNKSHAKWLTPEVLYKDAAGANRSMEEWLQHILPQQVLVPQWEEEQAAAKENLASND